MAPIHDACRAGDVEAVRRELAAGVSPDLRASTLNSFPGDVPNSIPVWTPLCVALVYTGSYQSATALLETVSLLIEAGADVDAVCNLDRFRYTAIWFAAHSGRRNLVTALIAAGVSTSLHVGGGSFDRPLRPVERGFNDCGHNGNQLHILWQLLRAGSPLPRSDRAKWMRPGSAAYNAAAIDYVNAVAAAGGYVPYERAHRQRLAAIFAPKFTWLPAEVVPTIVAFWAHLGHP
jgi:hypothetical protein